MLLVPINLSGRETDISRTNDKAELLKFTENSFSIIEKKQGNEMIFSFSKQSKKRRRGYIWFTKCSYSIFCIGSSILKSLFLNQGAHFVIKIFLFIRKSNFSMRLNGLIFNPHFRLSLILTCSYFRKPYCYSFLILKTSAIIRVC